MFMADRISHGGTEAEGLWLRWVCNQAEGHWSGDAAGSDGLRTAQHVWSQSFQCSPHRQETSPQRG